MEGKKQQAQQYEDQGRAAIKEKRYDDAIKAFTQAIQLYREIRFDGQVGILTKEIKRVESLKAILGPQKPTVVVQTTPTSAVNTKELEKEATTLENKVKQLVFEKNFPEAITTAQQLIGFYEKLNYAFQIKKMNFEIEKFRQLEAQFQRNFSLSEKIQEETQLSIAEERSLRLKKEKEFRETETRKRMEEIEQAKKEKETETRRRLEELEQAKKDREEALHKREAMDSKLKKAAQDRMAVFEAKTTGQDLSIFKKEADERQKKLEELQKKKQIEEKLLADANFLMDLAKNAYDDHQFEDAIGKYQEAAKIFNQLGWNQQADVLKKEVLNVQAKQIELKKKQAEEEALRKKQQEEYEARAKQMQAELEEKKRKEEAERNKLPPEILRKIEIIEMVLEKARELEERQKFDKALVRYESIIELVRELPATVDYSKKIEAVNEKIKELKSKIPPTS